MEEYYKTKQIENPLNKSIIVKMDNKYTITTPIEKPNFKNGFILTHLIYTALQKAKIQQKRIENEMTNQEDLVRLFGDIHYLFINIGNMKDFMKAMCDILNEDKKLEEIYNKYFAILEKCSVLRNHLEHTDERLGGCVFKKPLSEPNMFGNLIGYEYNFGGDKIDLREVFKLCDEILIELKDWNKISKIYPVWD